MIGWIVRLLLIFSGTITGWFVSHEALNFPVIKMLVAIGLFTAFATLLAFWPSIISRSHKKPDLD